MTMKWDKLVTAERIGHRAPKAEDGRSPFNSDHDKIVFSGAFRRLAKKTQVHPLATNDHIHNRLTHSLEVACVGRSLGIRVGQELKSAGKLPENVEATDVGDIVHATCLAHDIGNPPFGHTGESAIRNWFTNDGGELLKNMKDEEKTDLQMFEGNAQGFRILTSAEYHPYDGGMRLTYATLASFMKYPWTSLPTTENKRPKKAKYGIFQSEASLFDEVASAVGLIKKEKDWYCRHPFVAMMEAADDFCYGILDLEDGLEMGILQWDQIYSILSSVICDDDKNYLENELNKNRPGRKPPVIRGAVIDAYVNSAAKAFLENESRFLAGEDVDLVSLCDPKVSKAVKDAKTLAKEKIFTHPRKVELEIGSYSVMATLLNVIGTAVLDYTASKNHTFKTSRVIDLIGENTLPTNDYIKLHKNSSPEYLAMMRAIDFISGCTDQYATYLAKQFNGMGETR
ncbi:deoxyguanosinetriphosphate triphosphohydrolase [Acidovorax sp. SUPP3434]|uniref:deoxyguanosinetriphosphate triphosphohydrolase n=1 Tax=Acidovorax sp. SUPP3434 TaxID=2920880 RepID=UPI0023DE2E2F|nr:deoxyguanosinetriphosphate triphosphohydrolase [Acidovorax sp. SUPP3434]GKS98832.1 deoxyguanosinetriphosphate triphosphohydrolase [Acidovorax sp. SUPP3434]